MSANQKKINLRLASWSDSKNLYELRMDETVRRNSIETDEFSFQSHEKWFSTSLAKSDRELYVAEFNGQFAGMGRADSFEEGYILSWAVSPKFRSQGLGREIVSQLLELHFPARAYIKSDNIGSIKIAEELGFRRLSNNDGILMFEIKEKI